MRRKAEKLELLSKRIKKGAGEDKHLNQPKEQKIVSKEKKVDHTLFKEFNEKFESVKEAFVKKAVRLTRGKKKRLAAKEHMLRRKYLTEFLKQSSYKNPDEFINLKEFDDVLKVIGDKKPKRKNKSISDKKMQQLAKESARTVQNVVSDVRFQKNPLEAIKLHLINQQRRKFGAEPNELN